MKLRKYYTNHFILMNNPITKATKFKIYMYTYVKNNEPIQSS